MELIGNWQLRSVMHIFASEPKLIDASEFNSENGGTLADIVCSFYSDNTYRMYDITLPEKDMYRGSWSEKDGEYYFENPVSENMDAESAETFNRIGKDGDKIVLNMLAMIFYFEKM